jgi:type I restriction-modification system DNA methylase subunit
VGSMLNQYNLVQQLTSEATFHVDQRRRLNDFAAELGWRPSGQLSLPGTESFASGHLVVEHGLQNSALISFLRRPATYGALDLVQQKSLINASYNNLIDWNIAIDSDGANFIYNRTPPPKFYSYYRPLARERTDELSGYRFEKLSTDHPSPVVPSLDSALIKTISLWKRKLSGEVGEVPNDQISALFNSVILVRALEDHRSQVVGEPSPNLRRRCLEGSEVGIARILAETIKEFGYKSVPKELFDVSKLRAFDQLDRLTVQELIEDFYRNRYERYFDYDFSIMSRHALSRIYEHYVSLLRFDEASQQSFFPPLPQETLERSFGNIYTPEFVARFFAKYVRKEISPSRFQRLRVGDIACGSGIFLRMMLEARFETLLDSFTTEAVAESFGLVQGIDIDANACAAARLSLSLLSVSLNGALPKSLDIVNADTLSRFQKDPSMRESLDVVVTNPLFVNSEDLPPERLEVLLDVLGTSAKGKTDLYLGLLKVGLAMLKDGGFGLFVLPQNFLISENAAPIREELLGSTVLHCVVDLSGIRIFEAVGAYVVLLIFQKTRTIDRGRSVLVARCNDLVGSALEDVLREREVRTPAYQVFWSPSPRTSDQQWEFPNPERASLHQKLQRLPTVGHIADVRQGIITGADPTFVVSAGEIPKGEREVFVPFLPDREMEPYSLPQKPKHFVFYPFRGDNPLGEDELRAGFPKTWAYLERSKPKLSERRSVLSGDTPWWRPNRSREPRRLLLPKVVTPHLVIAPRFGVDEHGIFAVSHAPYIVPREPAGRDELLYLAGILNSTPCFWLITQNAHRYSRGYSRLEVATLKRTPVPDPDHVDSSLVREIIRLVGQRMLAKGPDATEIERELDRRVAEAYGLNKTESRLVGIGAIDEMYSRS